MVHTSSLLGTQALVGEFDSAARLSKSWLVCWDTHSCDQSKKQDITPRFRISFWCYMAFDAEK